MEKRPGAVSDNNICQCNSIQQCVPIQPSEQYNTMQYSKVQ